MTSTTTTMTDKQYEEWVAILRPELTGYLRGRGKSCEEAEDMVADAIAFVWAAHRKKPLVMHTRKQLAAYLHRALAHAMYTAHAKPALVIYAASDVEMESHAAENDVLRDALANIEREEAGGKEPLTHQEIWRERLAERMDAARLTPRQRQSVEGALRGELSAETGTRISMSASRVRALKSEAIEKMQRVGRGEDQQKAA